MRGEQMIRSSSGIQNMAEIKALSTTILLLFLTFLFNIPKVASKPAGFSLKLIRSYSPMSNYRNITFHERYKSYIHASKARASYWTSFKATSNKTIKPDAIQPLLTHEHETIVVSLWIGTPSQQVFLEFDTGSYNSWTQCASCTTCFPQSMPMYDPNLSSSFREMSSDDSYCNPPIYFREHICRYRSRFIAGQYTNGIGSYDTFASTYNNPDQAVANIRFGCSLEAGGFRFPSGTKISGLLAMSKTEESFLSQLNQYGINGRFSYCFVDINTAPSIGNRVTFGDDIPNISPGQILETVPFINHHYPHAWAINIHDISVGEERLNLPPGTFDLNPDGGSGGLVFDTGSPLTILTRDAYFAIKSKIQNHLSSGDFAQISGDYDCCYRYTGPAGQLPMDYLQTLTFHLDNGVDLVMPVTSVYLFNWEAGSFCLGIWTAASNWPNILGALQQQDTRFIYDLSENSLSFIPELCAGNQA